MPIGAGRAEAEAKQKLLLQIAGEVDPSYKSALQEVKREKDRLQKTFKDMDQRVTKTTETMENFAKRALPTAAFKKYREAIKRTGSASAALAERSKGTIKSLLGQGKAAGTAKDALKGFFRTMRIGRRYMTRFEGKAKDTKATLIGLKTALIAIIAVGAFKILAGGISTFLGLIKQAAAAVAELFKSLLSYAAEAVKRFELVQMGLDAMTRSSQTGASYMRVLRTEAINAGQDLLKMAEGMRGLIPYTGGDPDRLRQLTRLVLRAQMLRPDLEVRSVARAVTQYLSGIDQTLIRTLGVSSGLIKEIEKLGVTGADALDMILTRMRIGEDALGAYANTWKGLGETLRTFGQTIVRNIAGPAFERVQAIIADFVNWMRENQEQIRSLTAQLGAGLGANMGQLTDAVFGPEGLSEEALFDAAKWGTDLVASLAEGILRGINEFVIPAIMQVTEIIASFLMGTSPPRMGILSTIDRWFGPVIRAYLSGFNAEDFKALADIGKIIKASLQTAVAGGDISADEMKARLLEARKITVDMVHQLRTAGAVAAATWAQLGQVVGMDVTLVQGYLDLVERVKAAQAALTAAQEAYAAALRKVKRIQEEIRLFELRTAEIPERYKRGRRMEMEFRLMAAQKEAQAKQEAVKRAQAELQAAKQMLSAYMQMIQALSDMAQQMAELKKAQEEEAEAIPPWVEGLGKAGDAIAKLEGPFADLFDYINERFSGAREQFEELVDFIRGLFGRPMVEGEMPRGMQRDIMTGAFVPSDAYERGVQFRDILNDMAESGFSAAEAIEKIFDILIKLGDKLLSIVDWWEGLPETNILKLIFSGKGTQELFGGGAPGFDFAKEFQQVSEDLYEFWSGILPGGLTAEEVIVPQMEALFAKLGQVITGKEGEVSSAVQDGVVSPVVSAFEELEDTTVGHSIFPDMMDKILTLFKELPDKVRTHLQRFVRVIQIQGGNATEWFTFYITEMRRALNRLIESLYTAIQALQSYGQAVQAANVGATGNIPEYQHGGLVGHLTQAIVHPGELILNVAQQRNLATALAGAGPQAGFGAGAVTVTVNQRNWTISGPIGKAELGKFVEDHTYQGIHRVFREAEARG